MAIINRIARLFKADLHAVLDHIEEPELQLKQSIREMQEELDATEVSVKHCKRDIEVLQDREKTAHDLIKQTGEEINVCLANDNDDLARGLIRRRLETQAILQHAKRQKKQTLETLETLVQQQQEQASTLESLRQKSALILERETSDARQSSELGNAFSALQPSVQDADVEVALLKEKEQFSSASTNN